MTWNNRIKPYIGNEILEFLIYKQMEMPEMKESTIIQRTTRWYAREQNLTIRVAG